MGGRPEYRVKKWGPYLEKQKMQLFLHFIKIRKISKGGTLGLKKIQSARIWTKLAGLVGTIKKISWDVILKFACTLLGCERPKTKNDAKGVPLEQKNSKFSNLAETCRTGRGHQKNELGSDFEVFLHLV